MLLRARALHHQRARDVHESTSLRTAAVDVLDGFPSLIHRAVPFIASCAQRNSPMVLSASSLDGSRTRSPSELLDRFSAWKLCRCSAT